MNEVTADDLIEANQKYYSRVINSLNNSTTGLLKLDQWRNEFPAELAKRYDEDPELYITHEELKKLMDWKLKKGKFRPSLKKLINENDSGNVMQVTKDAFKLILSSTNETDLDEEAYIKLIKSSLSILIKLRGVGPATASLILSLLNKITKIAPPFYSDEAAYYIFRLNDGPEKLKYSLPEYLKFLRLFFQLNSKFLYDFTDLENGAWALELKDNIVLEEVKNEEDATDSLEEKDVKSEDPPKKRQKTKN